MIGLCVISEDGAVRAYCASCTQQQGLLGVWTVTATEEYARAYRDGQAASAFCICGARLVSQEVEDERAKKMVDAGVGVA